MKKTLKYFSIIILLLIILRGPLFRLLFNYIEIGQRNEVQITNKNLIQIIDQKTEQTNLDLKSVTRIANQITRKQLKFTTRKASNNPNQLMKTNKANCVGYSTMFNSIADHIIRSKNLQQKFQVKHKIAEINFIGMNLHKLFEDPFFSDHDYNQITDLETGKIIHIDPSLSDYFKINRIKVKPTR